MVAELAIAVAIAVAIIAVAAVAVGAEATVTPAIAAPRPVAGWLAFKKPREEFDAVEWWAVIWVDPQWPIGVEFARFGNTHAEQRARAVAAEFTKRDIGPRARLADDMRYEIIDAADAALQEDGK